MRKIAVLLLDAGLVLALFGWWGVNTAAGRRRFDEMDGIIPFAAGVSGVVLFATGAVLALVVARRAAAARRRGSAG